MSGGFHVRPHLSAALLTRLISAVLARLLAALDDEELDDSHLVALAVAVGRSTFTDEVKSSPPQHRPQPPPPLTDDKRQSRSDSSATAPHQVTYRTHVS